MTLTIGCCWAGRPEFSRDAVRSIPYATFAPLFDVPGTHWIALFTGAQRDDAPNHPCLEKPALPDVATTTKRMQGIDLMITVDTLPAHLAGSLGVPTWLLLPYSPDWRWLRGTESSVWYPSVRLMRQEHHGDWDHVIERVRGELHGRGAIQGTSGRGPCEVPPRPSPVHI